MDIFIMALAITIGIFCLMIDRPLLRLSILVQLEINIFKIKIHELKIKKQRADYLRKIDNARNPIQIEIYQATDTKLDNALKEIKILLER